MFEVSEKMQSFIHNDCDMDGKLACNLLKLFGGETEFVQNYEVHIKKGISTHTPRFNESITMTQFWEENKVDCMIWATAQAQEHENTAEWLASFNNKPDAKAALPTTFIIELAYQFCTQYKDFIIDFE